MQVEDWGLIDYKEAEEKQLLYVNEVASGKRQETIVFCSHSPVVTTGRATEAGDVFSWSGPIYEISRGGRATYHGPNQLVMYPILDLKKTREGVKPRDIHSYLRALEAIIINLFSELGLDSYAKDTGVWIEDRKLASIGIGVRKWVSYHGIAINISSDSQAFTGIKPCGFTQNTMASLEEVLKQKTSRAVLQSMLLQSTVAQLKLTTEGRLVRPIGVDA